MRIQHALGTRPGEFSIYYGDVEAQQVGFAYILIFAHGAKGRRAGPGGDVAPWRQKVGGVTTQGLLPLAPLGPSVLEPDLRRKENDESFQSNEAEKSLLSEQ